MREPSMSMHPYSLRPVADEQQAANQLQQRVEQLQQMSLQLGNSYGLLEARVSELKGQLAQASAERLEQLAEKERLAQRLQSLLDILPGGVVVLDGRGRVVEANPLALELLGEPLLGVFWREVIQRSFAPRADDGHEISLQDGRRLSLATRSLAGEPGQLILLTDLTETRRLQDELARHARLSALGRMVASLAHQIRTPLSTALLYASHLAEQTLPVEQQQRFAARLKERLHELERQVRDMLVFTRGDLPLPDRLTPAQCLFALREASAQLLEGQQVRWQCDARDGLLVCHRDVLLGALHNLLENACQSAPGPLRIKVHLYRRGEHLRLCVSDNGPGMTAQLVQQLGEPMVSSKPQGTGLGLAVVKAVAQAHRGRLLMFSRLGRGTCAVLELPLLVAASEVASCPR